MIGNGLKAVFVKTGIENSQTALRMSVSQKSYGRSWCEGYGIPAGSGHSVTQRNLTIMSWNLMHLARLLSDKDGYSNEGNDRTAWKAGCHFGYANPEHRA